MNLTPISHCTKNLSFSPLHTPHPSVIGYAWRGFQISHFECEPKLLLEVQGPLEEILPIVYRKLSLPEFARLFDALRRHHLTFDPEKILHAYHLKWSQDLSNIFDLLINQSPEFQNWCSEKDLGLMELKPLLLALHLRDLSNWTSQICKLNPNRHLGSKIIEFVFMNPSHEVWVILENSKTAEIAYQQLHQMRYPISSQHDLKMVDFVKAFPWPAHVKANWQREGDRSGIRLEFFTLNSEDYVKKISQLSDLQHKLQSTWKKNNGN